MFCKYCGKELLDGELCGCPQAKAEREQNQSDCEPVQEEHKEEGIEVPLTNEEEPEEKEEEQTEKTEDKKTDSSGKKRFFSQETKERVKDRYTQIHQEASEKTKDARKQGIEIFSKMRRIFVAYVSDPQKTIEAALEDGDRAAAWGWYWLFVALMFLEGWVIGGVALAFFVALAGAVIHLFMPTLVYMMVRLRKNPADLKAVFAAFWVKDIPVYGLLLLGVVFGALQMVPLVLVMAYLAAVTRLMLDFLAATIVCRGSVKEGLVTAVLAQLVFALVMAVILFIVSVIIMGTFSRFMMYSGSYGWDRDLHHMLRGILYVLGF